MLEPANMDGSRRIGCLEDTRTDVLKLVVKWVSDTRHAQTVLWLHGPAGSGKSTISTTLADHFRLSKQLGAFLFFDRDVTERSNPTLVPRTLAYQLSSFHSNIGDLIITAVENSPQTLISSISSQFQELLVDPLSRIDSYSTTQVVLILDALDECGTSEDRSILVNVLAEKSALLPSTIRFVITSRPDVEIRAAFESQPHILTLELDLTSVSAQRDILTYFGHHMDNIQRKNRYLGNGWPGQKAIDILVRHASGLFVWASVACNFIDAHDPQKRLNIILQHGTASTAEVALDALYETALEFSGAWDDEDFVADFRDIFGIILFLRNPLTSTAIDNLLANPDGVPSAQIIGRLSCVVSSNPTIRLIHPSLADFFTNRSRCGLDIWFFAATAHERTLAILCLHRLANVLDRNMSQLGLLVDDGDYILNDVSYACIFWVDHICTVDDDLVAIQDALEHFINGFILNWFEAMSLLKRFKHAISLLDQLSDWIQKHDTSSHERLLELVRYWWRFAQEYETIIQERPMCVYSKKLHREFQIIEVQEPLVSPSPTHSIFDLTSLSPASVEVASRQNSPLQRSASPCFSDYLDQTYPASHASSSEHVAGCRRRLSRSSLNLSSGRNSSQSRHRRSQSLRSSNHSMSRPSSPSQTYIQRQPKFGPPVTT